MDASTLISAWELALAYAPAARMAAVVTAGGNTSAWSIDIDQREREALRLHRAIAGDTLDAQASCAHCGERMDIGLPLSMLNAEAASDPCVEHGDWRIALRVPSTQDVCEALAQSDSETALFRACITAAHQAGEARSPDELPGDVRRLCEERLDQLAPLANLALALRCPACGHMDTLPLDIGAYVFERLGYWAEDQLEEVAQLCRAYGWEERHVLAMSPWRRRFYLERAEVA